MIRADHELIAQGIRLESRVLDLGCGDGQLLAHLQRTRRATGYGIEIVPERVVAALRQGIQVLQVNLESGLSGFAAGSFDTVILSQTLQAMRNTEEILREMLRVGREGIVTFPNFGYWKHRWQVLNGMMPKSPDMPYEWYDTPNVHLCTLQDFEALCARMGVQVIERRVMNPAGRVVHTLPNLLGSLAYYRIRSAV
ncbi:MAG: methionine biosynthesis protein MetW [Ferrovum sp.]|nr:methionine biosynthesis protein MetW [Ferrovum sp.]NDU87862.1 methionine biosynthesis protein MetW [Ferrovum sp.]